MFVKKKSNQSTPSISTASLPDIVFMLLFFFMVVTVLKSHTIRMETRLPETTDRTKLSNKNKVNYIYIGKTYNDQKDKLQFNDTVLKLDQLKHAILKNRVLNGTKELSTVIKIDKGVKMSLVNKVKLELRKADARKIHYITDQEKT